jgi:AraC-like DNA-binding protein
MPRPDPPAHASASPGGRPVPGRGAPACPIDEAPGVETLRFSTCDPVEGLEVLGRVYAVKKIRVAPDAPFSIAQEARSIPNVGLERARFAGAPAAALVEAPETVRVGRVLGGRLAVAETTTTAPGASPFLFPSLSYTAAWGDLDLLTVSLDVAALRAHAAGLLGVEHLGLRFTGTSPVSPAMARHLAAAVTAFGRDQLGNAEAMASPLIRAEAFRCLATAVLHTFPNTFLDQPPAPGQDRPVPAGVRRAVAFMEEHLAADIGLPEIAAAARMSPRGLQAAFRREKDTTPLEYLRTARLDAAHRDLLAADPATGVTVEAVALRWGFTHRGRFAAAYRERHGQSPATTLRT